MQSVIFKVLWLAVVAIFVLNCTVLYSWLYYDDSDIGKIKEPFRDVIPLIL